MASRRIERSDLLSLAEYEKQRAERVRRVIALKTLRRVEIGPWVSLVFENRDTVLHQIQEMLRIERITEPAAIDHEIETFAELLPAEGELSATMFIEISDPAQRSAALATLGGVEKTVALRAGDLRAPAYDKRPIDPRFERPGQATAVYYLGFKLPDRLAASLAEADLWAEVDHPRYRHAAAMPAEQRRELVRDLVG